MRCLPVWLTRLSFGSAELGFTPPPSLVLVPGLEQHDRAMYERTAALQTVPLDLDAWALIALIAAPVFIVPEVIKVVLRRRSRA